MFCFEGHASVIVNNLITGQCSLIYGKKKFKILTTISTKYYTSKDKVACIVYNHGNVIYMTRVDTALLSTLSIIYSSIDTVVSQPSSL